MARSNEPRHKRTLRLVDMHRDGDVSLQLYENQGNEFWRLVRDTPKGPEEIAVGHQSELDAIKSVFNQAGQSQEKPRLPSHPPSWWSTLRAPIDALSEKLKQLFPNPQEETSKEPSNSKKSVWYALVKLHELTDSGARGGVVMSFNSLKKAERYQEANPLLALYPKPLAEKPEKGTKVEITHRELDALYRKGQGQDFAEQLTLLKWKKEQGQWFELAFWNDRSEEPRLNQKVLYTSGLNDRGKPVDRLAKPLGSLDPGQAETPRFVLIEKFLRLPGVGQIIALPINQADGDRLKKELNAEHAFRQNVLDPQQWPSFELGGQTLRGMADREMKFPTIPATELAEKIASLAKPGQERSQVDMENLRIRTHIKGGYRADVIERVGEDGQRQLSVVLSHAWKDQDGKQRTAGVVFDFHELMSYRREVARNKPREQRREVANASQERPQERKPTSERTPLATRQVEKPEVVEPEKAGRHELPAGISGPPLKGVQDNKFWIAGIWCGKTPPEKNTLAYFAQGKNHPSERMMLPVKRGSPIVEPGERPQYVFGQVFSSGVVRILGATRNLAYVVKEEASREQRDQAIETTRERVAQIRRGGPVSTPIIDALLAKPNSLGTRMEPPKPLEPPQDMGRSI